jgi:hypothetical protein
MRTIGDAVADYLDAAPATDAPTRSRGRLLNNVPSKHLKETRHNQFPGTNLQISNARLGFVTPDSMRKLGFKVPDSLFFAPLAALARARYQ